MKFLVMFVAVFAWGQPTFEVATVKPTPAGTRILGDLVSQPGGRVVATRCTLELL